VELFVEPLQPNWSCWIFGAGHVGRALVRAARELPLRVSLVDDRPEFVPDLDGLTGHVAGPAELGGTGFAPDPRLAVVIASHSHEQDAAYLGAVLEAEREAGCEVAYLGVVGSDRKARTIRADLAARGADARRLQRVRIPVGLEIAAETPAEIALGILAEMIAELRGAATLVDDAGEGTGLPFRRRRDAVRRAPGA
jgi:xanthine dehydrogenase accessory factor